jgi:hypothetical protein
MTRFIALFLCLALSASGCAMNHSARVQTAPAPAVSDATVLADFASQLKVGSDVRATITGNRTVRGTLLKRTDRAIVIQPRTRVAEPLMEVPFDELLALEQLTPSSGSTGRAIAIGAGVGAGAAIGTLFLVAALLWGSN